MFIGSSRRTTRRSVAFGISTWRPMSDDPRDGNGGFAAVGGAGGQQMVYVCDSSRRRRSTLLPLWTFSTPRSALLSKRSCRRRGRRRQKPRKSVRQTLFHCSVLHRQRDRKPNRITLLIYSNIRMTFPGLSRPVKKRRMVGATGFEPATSWSQTTRSTKLSYAPIVLPAVAEGKFGCLTEPGCGG